MDTILLLEDEESLRRGICFKLEKEGYNVDCCFDGNAARWRRVSGCFVRMKLGLCYVILL